MGIELKVFRIQVVLLIAVFLVGTSFASGKMTTEPASLKLIVYGATGRVGSRVVDEALI